MKMVALKGVLLALVRGEDGDGGVHRTTGKRRRASAQARRKILYLDREYVWAKYIQSKLCLVLQVLDSCYRSSPTVCVCRTMCALRIVGDTAVLSVDSVLFFLNVQANRIILRRLHCIPCPRPSSVAKKCATFFETLGKFILSKRTAFQILLRRKRKA